VELGSEASAAIDDVGDGPMHLLAVFQRLEAYIVSL
jgi:hypothetical protein